MINKKIITILFPVFQKIAERAAGCSKDVEQSQEMAQSERKEVAAIREIFESKTADVTNVAKKSYESKTTDQTKVAKIRSESDQTEVANKSYESETTDQTEELEIKMTDASESKVQTNRDSGTPVNSPIWFKNRNSHHFKLSTKSLPICKGPIYEELQRRSVEKRRSRQASLSPSSGRQTPSPSAKRERHTSLSPSFELRRGSMEEWREWDRARSRSPPEKGSNSPKSPPRSPLRKGQGPSTQRLVLSPITNIRTRREPANEVDELHKEIERYSSSLFGASSSSLKRRPESPDLSWTRSCTPSPKAGTENLNLLREERLEERRSSVLAPCSPVHEVEEVDCSPEKVKSSPSVAIKEISVLKPREGCLYPSLDEANVSAAR